jgi:hypothetical protein
MGGWLLAVALTFGMIATAEEIVSSRIKAIAIVFPFKFADFIVFPKNCIFLFSFNFLETTYTRLRRK